MARKKKLTLEQEFELKKEEHKCTIIMYTLIKYKDTIYDSRYFKRYKNMPVKLIEGYENIYNEDQTRAYRVEEDITNRDANGEKGLYDKVYEFCWRRAKKNILDNAAV